MADTVPASPDARLLTLTTQIVVAYVTRNRVDAKELPALIQDMHAALASAGAETKQAGPRPAVPVQRSIHHEYLICLEDGAKVKMLKRHIAARYGLTPDQYRQKWDLPASYPMTAPAYAERRSKLAKEFGLGRKPKADPMPQPEPEIPPPAKATPANAAKAGAKRAAKSGMPTKRPGRPTRRAAASD